MLSIRASTGVAILPVKRVHCYRDSHRLAIAHYVQIHFGTRALLPDDHLQVPCIADLVAVDSGNDISHFQTRLGAGRIWLYLADHSANGLVHVEELGILRSHVGDGDSNISMVNLAVFDQRLHRRARNLRGNGKAHSRK